MTKHIDKQQGKIKHEAPRSVNYRATQNKNNIGTHIGNNISLSDWTFSSTSYNETNCVQKIRLLSLNVCGLSSKPNCPEFMSLLHEQDIICIQECKLDDLDHMNILGYHLYTKNREPISRCRPGGIALIVKCISTMFADNPKRQQARTMVYHFKHFIPKPERRRFDLWCDLYSTKRFKVCQS